MLDPIPETPKTPLPSAKVPVGATAVNEPTAIDALSGPFLTSANLVGQTVDGRYEILARLGAGGMGTVYKARHVLMDQIVALKIIHASLAQRRDVRERFLREAKATMLFVHPNVVPVRDVGVTPEGVLYMTLDYSPGRSLRSLLVEAGAFPERRTLAIVRQILRALEAAHAHGIIHRDLKPENVLVETREKTGEEVVRVVDFGMAKLLETPLGSGGEDLTGGGFVGTPHYVAPEQACGESTDGRTDIYALGCLFYELLTGTRVFTADSTSKVLMKHLTQAPQPPSKLVPLLSPKLESLVLKALAKEPGDRPQSAGEFLRLLDEIDVHPKTARRLRVLFAEDNLINQRLTRKMLERWGHEVVVVGNGREALAMSERSPFDVILMDGQMPELDGYEATAKLREREAATGRHVPVIALTADGGEAGRARCLQAGMDAHVAKPIAPEELFEAVEHVVRALIRSGEPTANADSSVFDSSAALARVDGDVDLLRDIVVMFLSESPRLLEKIRAGVAAGRMDEVARAAYELKGVAGNCAATAVQEAATLVERLARAEDAAVGPAVDAIEVASRRLLPALARVLEKRAPCGS